MKMTLDEYLSSKGLSSPISDFMLDKLRIPHGLTARQMKKLEKDAAAAALDYSERRIAAIKEYEWLVAKGEIVPKDKVSQLIETANGHPDNESVQAARRCCEKRGIDWTQEELTLKLP